MPVVLPLAALRYNPDRVHDLAHVLCPPYDVISPSQQAAFQALSPYNAVHLELPIDVRGEAGSRYAHAAALLADWRQSRVLQPDHPPTYYLHRTTFSVGNQSYERRDLIAALGVEPWSTGAVKPHEHTMPGAKADRMALLRATHANLSPIWVLYRQPPTGLSRAWAWAESREPDVRVPFEGEQHELWLVDQPEMRNAIESGFRDGGPLYIADGHHRYETALAFAEQAEAETPGARATLAVVTWAEDPGLRVLPTHRMLARLPADASPESLLQAWSQTFDTAWQPLANPAGERDAAAILKTLAEAGRDTPAFGFVFHAAPDRWLLLTLRDRAAAASRLPADRSDAWKQLDVTVLHELLLEPLLEAASMERLNNLTYTRVAAEAVRSAQAGTAQAAVLLNATRVQQVLDVADARDRMPEKSTYFFPKPPTGLVIRDVDAG